jgi:hypothetical protein
VKKDNKNKITTTENQAISSFENFFYRYVAWFPILVLPALVWEMFSVNDYVPAGLIGVMHAVLVFRLVTIAGQQGWFKKRQQL